MKSEMKLLVVAVVVMSGLGDTSATAEEGGGMSSCEQAPTICGMFGLTPDPPVDLQEALRARRAPVPAVKPSAELASEEALLTAKGRDFVFAELFDLGLKLHLALEERHVVKWKTLSTLRACGDAIPEGLAPEEPVNREAEHVAKDLLPDIDQDTQR
jgi:hypothetical protein